MENTLTTGPVFSKLVRFALPIFFASLLQAMYGTVDLMIVGLYSDASSVSAVSTGSMTMQTVTAIIIGLTMGCTVLLGQSIGKKDFEKAARSVWSAFTLFVLLGIVLLFSVVAFSAPIAKVMNAPSEALNETIGYIRVCGAGILFIILFNAISGMYRGIGNSKLPLILMIIACICNIVGDLVLVGSFHLGAVGAAIATVGAQAISVVFALGYIKKIGFGFPLKGFKAAKLEMIQIIRYGLPIAMQEALTGVSFMVILAILNSFGLIASAGVGVAEKICALMFLIPGTAMSSISAFVAQNMGAKQYKRANQAMYYGILISVLAGVAVFIFSFFEGTFLAGFFTSDPLVQAAAADYLRSYSIDCIIVGFNFSMMGYLNGCGKTSFVALQGIICTFAVRIPVSYFMSKIPNVTLFQVGFATPAASLLGLILCVCYVIYYRKKAHI